MKIRTRFYSTAMFFVVLLAIFTLSCSKKGGTGGGSNIVWTFSTSLTMSLGAGFTPRNDSVTVGTILTWTNTDPVNNHNVKSNSGTELNSMDITPGNTYVDTMNTPGLFEYRCTLHPSMTGRVKVVP